MQIFEGVLFLQVTNNIKTEKQTIHLAYVSLMLGCVRRTIQSSTVSVWVLVICRPALTTCTGNKAKLVDMHIKDKIDLPLRAFPWEMVVWLHQVSLLMGSSISLSKEEGSGSHWTISSVPLTSLWMGLWVPGWICEPLAGLHQMRYAALPSLERVD